MNKPAVNKFGEYDFEDIALRVPKMLLPKKGTDMTAYAAVACDQYTSQPEYWEKAEKFADGKPSTLNLMLPEAYLNAPDVDARIEKINKTMNEYIENGTLEETEPCIMLVQRDTGISPLRTGVVAALDLEKYDFTKGSETLIRATEGTVAERIPPRMKVRKNASIELPHIMILIDDPDCKVIEGVADYAKTAPADAVAYDFDLMGNGGHIKGTKITDMDVITRFAEGLKGLTDPSVFESKYDVPAGTAPLLFAMGDGNHSLASAKCHWEELKKAGAPMDHPARYALAEIINVHDSGIIFEPIHRVVFGAGIDRFIDGALDFFGENASYACVPDCEDAAELLSCVSPSENFHSIPVCTENECGIIFIDKKVHTLAVGAIQEYLDYAVKNGICEKIDYVHGDDTAFELGVKENNIGLLLPSMEKSDLFTTVIKNGSLPRKTFSMGEPNEKRFYIEARKIV